MKKPRKKWLTENDKVYDWLDLSGDHPEQFVGCADSHPNGLALCSVYDDRATKLVGDLKACKRFEYEPDYEEGKGYSLTCAHCLGLGFRGRCEKHYTGVKVENNP